MRIHFLCLLFLFLACKKNDTNNSSSYPNLYGNGVYIVTDQGINYYNDISGSLEENIFSSVNGISINNPKKIVLHDQNVFIVGNRLYVVGANSFHLKGEVSGFNNLTDCNVISFNRVLAVDKGESRAKVVDLEEYEVITDIETGDSTKPSFVISTSSRSFVLNGGGIPRIKKDTTMIIIHHNSNGLPISDFTGRAFLGDNPNSAIIEGSKLIILCKGVYNTSFPSNNSPASLYKVNKYGGVIDTEVLSGVYNANSLILNTNENKFYFTAADGIYKGYVSSMSSSLFLNRSANILNINLEQYNTSDSTYAYADMLYMNDIHKPGYVFKYNTAISTYTDSFFLSGNVLDISIN